jgi:uncharacterized protein YhfF
VSAVGSAHRSKGAPTPCHPAMWSAHLAVHGDVDATRFDEAFSFGDSPAMADELGQLVLAGIKRATAASVWSYEESERGAPKPGDLSVVLDSAQRPLCIIETEQVDVVAFDQVSAGFAAREGEGDGSLAGWRRAHTGYFTRECERSGRAFSETMAIACERFKVVYPSAARSAG